jgi:predicted ATPase
VRSAVKPAHALKRLTTVAAGQADPLTRLDLLNPTVSATLAAVIHQALALTPEARFPDAAAMRLALHATGGDATVIASAPTSQHAPAPGHNLPAQLTSFVGREAEVALVQQLLQADDVRLVTLTGPGGIGKTRLALSLATRCLGHFADGVYFVSLAPVREPHLVLPALAQTLGVREAANTTVMESLQAYLRDKALLLVLDNFEQVVAAAPLVGELLVAAPRIKVLVTSREVLQIRGEREFSVPTLALPHPKQLPSLETLAQVAAIKLFVQRAQAVKPSFLLNQANAAAVTEICRRLDGLPLAIELAAASIKVLSAQALLTRLVERFELPHSGARDAPDRQRTLHASIQWSYDLLAEDERALFRRLAVFRGSFALAAAEHLCQHTGLDGIDALTGIVALCDKSLLKPLEAGEDEPRFMMLETLREFGLRQLALAGEAEAVQESHAAYYCERVREAERQIWGANIATAVHRLEIENDNVRVALNYYLAHPAGATRALEMAGLLWRFWEIRGYMVEGRAWLDRALQRREETPRSSRWLALHGAGNLAVDQGEYAVADGYYRESLELLQEQLSTQTEPASLQTQYAIGNTLLNLGNLALLQSEFEQAVAFSEEALALHRQLQGKLKSEIGIGITLANLAKIKLHQGDYAQAEAFSQESLALYRQLGDERGMGWNLATLGTIARERGDYVQAAQLYGECRRLLEKLSNEADLPALYCDLGELARIQGDDAQAEANYEAGLTLAQALGSKKDVATLLDGLSVIAGQRGAYAQAIALSEQSITLHREIGNRAGLSEALHNRGQIAYAQQEFAAATAHYTESLMLKAQLGDRRGLVHSFKAFAALAMTPQAQPERAARLLGATEQLRRAIGISQGAASRQQDETMISTLQTSLGESAFARAWAAGEALELAQAIAYARGEESP